MATAPISTRDDISIWWNPRYRVFDITCRELCADEPGQPLHEGEILYWQCRGYREARTYRWMLVTYPRVHPWACARSSPTPWWGRSTIGVVTWLVRPSGGVTGPPCLPSQGLQTTRPLDCYRSRRKATHLMLNMRDETYPPPRGFRALGVQRVPLHAHSITDAAGLSNRAIMNKRNNREV